MNTKNQLEEMSLIDHLTELRRRLLWSFIYIIIIFCVCFYFASDLFYFLAKPLVNLLNVDEGQGFKEKDTNKIFKRFYSNRPDKFGQHSGLGLNIVKNLVDLHNASIKASNRLDQKGASMKIIFPSV